MFVIERNNKIKLTIGDTATMLVQIFDLDNKEYEIQEAWEWSVQDYKIAFDRVRRLSPKDYRKGKCIYLSAESQVQVR